ncbi:MAG: proline dehydrogenase family protein, partial [Verrucomicrobia bacterium]|nr:proline dehydrogenase family protein [Verrucomicrobiota bacterium]
MNALQDEIRATGEKIFALMEGETASLFRKDFWYGQVMDWSMRNEAFKVQMFRFVDVLPCLNSSQEVARHLQEYFHDAGPDLPRILSWGLGLSGFAPGLLAAAVKKNVTEMARMFITGATADEALVKLKQLRSQTLAFTVDLLGEAAVSESEADEYQGRYLGLIEGLAREAAGWPNIDQIDQDHLGPIPRVNVSVKLTALDSQIDPTAPERALEVLKRRLRPLFRRARELGVFMNLDMESYAVKDLTLALFKSLMEE